MSQMYIMEPPTNGKIVLRTSAGDIDIELWVSYFYIYSSQSIFSQKKPLLQLEILFNYAWKIIMMQRYFIDSFLVLLFKVEIQPELEWAVKVFLENHSKMNFIPGYVTIRKYLFSSPKYFSASFYSSWSSCNGECRKRR